MPDGAGRGRYLFWLAMGVSTMAAAMAVLLVVEMGQRRVVQRSIGLRTDSINAPAVECEREFLLFRQALDNAVNSRVPPEPEQLTLRYDLFLSRLVLLRDGSAAAVLGERPEYQSAMPKLTQWAMAADAVMLQTPPDPRALAGLLVQVNALAADVRVLTLAANSQVAHLLEHQALELLDQSEKIMARAGANIQRFALRPRFGPNLAGETARLTGSVGPCGNTRHPEHRHCQRVARIEYPPGQQPDDGRQPGGAGAGIPEVPGRQ